MITSEYLEQKVNFDEPILLVGPGIRTSGEEYCRSTQLFPPMDVALIWFAEKLAGKKGRIDVFDLPQKSLNQCCHNIDAVRLYLEKLGTIIPLGRINYLEGDIVECKFPPEEYGFIWDHGTLAGWSGCLPNSDYLDPQRIEKVLTTYHQALKNEGLAALCCYPGQTKFQELCQSNYHFEKINLQRDAYQTNFKQEQFDFDHLKDSFLLRSGFLIPKYKYHLILEMRK